MKGCLRNFHQSLSCSAADVEGAYGKVVRSVCSSIATAWVLNTSERVQDAVRAVLVVLLEREDRVRERG